MCGRYKDVEIKTVAASAYLSLFGVIVNAKWIAQINGDNFDIYCSER
jgi:hypothetical protein